jgi:hypothetical protein
MDASDGDTRMDDSIERAVDALLNRRADNGHESTPRVAIALDDAPPPHTEQAWAELRAASAAHEVRRPPYVPTRVLRSA